MFLWFFQCVHVASHGFQSCVFFARKMSFKKTPQRDPRLKLLAFQSYFIGVFSLTYKHVHPFCFQTIDQLSLFSKRNGLLPPSRAPTRRLHGSPWMLRAISALATVEFSSSMASTWCRRISTDQVGVGVALDPGPFGLKDLRAFGLS